MGDGGVRGFRNGIAQNVWFLINSRNDGMVWPTTDPAGRWHGVGRCSIPSFRTSDQTAVGQASSLVRTSETLVLRSSVRQSSSVTFNSSAFAGLLRLALATIPVWLFS
jgi:hypothetical protein